MTEEGGKARGAADVFLPDGGDVPALALAGGGTAAFVAGIVIGSRLLRVLGVLALLAGGGLYASRKLESRGKRIDAAEGTIRSELEDLDPVARAQVLTDVAKDQLS
jgi:hypothetical protein